MTGRGAPLAAAAAALLAAGCATPSSAPAPPAPVPAGPLPPEPSSPPPPAPPPPAPASWEDQDLASGDWRFAASPAARADYGEPDAAVFTLRCDAAQRRLLLSRAGAAAGAALTVRTTFSSRALPVGDAGAAPLPVSDPFLDEIVSSRGRIAVEAPGLPALILPTWPEPARVVEECRG